MLVSNLYTIGSKLLFFRKLKNLTQAQVAEICGISDRTYADIERGTSNMRLETFVKICEALETTPDSILIESNDFESRSRNILQQLELLPEHNQETALSLLAVYLDSLKKTD